MKGRVLIIAGSDSGGGAGIQADIKAVTAMNGFAATAITALTAQNTEGVHGVVAVEPAFIAQQIEVVLTDIGADALKTGMLHSAEVIGVVASSLKKHAPGVPLVVDPVPQLLKNVRVGDANAALADASVTRAIADAEARLGTSGRILVRKSGTEPLIRVMAEGDDSDLVRTVVDQVIEAIPRAKAPA